MTSDELLKKGGLFKVKVLLTGAFDKDDASQTESIEMMTQENGDPHYLIFRELTSAETLELQTTEESQVIGELEKLIPKALVDHTFINDLGNKTANGDVLNVLRISANLLVYVIEEWQKACPLNKRRLKDSGGLPASSSKAGK